MQEFNVDYCDIRKLWPNSCNKNPDDPSDVIKKWFSNYDTIEFLGLWEELSNENFNSAEFSLIKNGTDVFSIIII